MNSKSCDSSTQKLDGIPSRNDGEENIYLNDHISRPLSFWQKIAYYKASMCKELSDNDKFVFSGAYWRELDTVCDAAKTFGFENLTCIICESTARIEYLSNSHLFGAEYMVGYLGKVYLACFTTETFYLQSPNCELIKNEFYRCKELEEKINNELESRGR